jgi:hypothetical protein
MESLVWDETGLQKFFVLRNKSLVKMGFLSFTDAVSIRNIEVPQQQEYL